MKTLTLAAIALTLLATSLAAHDTMPSRKMHAQHVTSHHANVHQKPLKTMRWYKMQIRQNQKKIQQLRVQIERLQHQNRKLHAHMTPHRPPLALSMNHHRR